ncbi:hypothetical protein [Xenorhabdus szentirmaii]|uniref:Uncharacterized protein n=1 Tax=Xenorhabdus szentirmaii DSM 16338 TaxID=1427518 RepID=W1IRP6_9GAMM|nr:hypothetical protein [Xenorhabdus szentirmaii]CDL81157.1 conserved exported hypothetical protein [Xenorhabdus szentirmaii DSM 16338]
MKSILYALLLSAFYIPSVFAGLSTADTHSKRMQQDPSHQGELRKCTDLLPEGHEYTISIIGTSDKKIKMRMVSSRENLKSLMKRNNQSMKKEPKKLNLLFNVSQKGFYN